MSSDIAGALDRLQARIEQACERAGRDPGSVQLVAVSKGHPEEAIRAAYEAGMRVFGENYAQELGVKASALSDLREISWRFIGHLQRNKIGRILDRVSLLHSLDSDRLATVIDDAPLELRHAGSLSSDELQVWADAQLARRGLARVSAMACRRLHSRA